MSTVKYSSVEQVADEIIRRTDGKVVLGIPLGLGKPNQLVNALYQKIKAEPRYSLTIYTALSLGRPSTAGKSNLECRFLQPFIERVFGDYAELDYLQARNQNVLPPNIIVHEFFMQPGAELKNNYAQQHYMSSNYTHAARDINDHGINVLAQLVAEENGRYSFSCNPEVTLDLLPLLALRRQQGETIITVGQVHCDLPFMGISALAADDALDMVIHDSTCHTTLINTPNMPVSMTEHVIGINASSLVKDGGTLQIGIGALGDAITYALILRDQQNATYQQLLRDSGLMKSFGTLITDTGGIEPFEEGLYGCTEMLTYGLLRLLQEYIIRRKVRDTRHGYATDVCLHGGFFLGPRVFYESLKQLSSAQRQLIDMTNIGFVNHLYGHEELKREHRQHARFINTAFTVTLMGAIVSDQLENGRVVSGVGGQYNFVAQAHALEGARSVILLRSTRDTADGVLSNIVWSYGHTTIPRHLRDMVVTEYGIADLRGKSDSEIIMAMLNISDSRFQDELLAKAKTNGKISPDYAIPEKFRNNTPARLQSVYDQYRRQGLFPDFPLGSDFDEVEQQLLKALSWLKTRMKRPVRLLINMVRGVDCRAMDYSAHLERMQLIQPKTLKERGYRRLLMLALQATA